MADILKRVEELSDLFDNTGSERLEFSSGKRVGFYRGKSLSFLSNQIKKLYLEGRAIKEINRILKFKNDRTTSIDNLIEAMKDPNIKTPVKITKKELANRPKISGATGKGLSPANIILNNPEAKKEFIKFANTKGNTILNSMEEAGKIAKKYAPKGSKVSGYTSRTGFNDSGLRELITKKVQLGKQTLNPEVTKRLINVKQAIENANLPKTELKADSPSIIKLASDLDMSVNKFLGDVDMIKTGRVGDFNKKLFNRIPQKGFTESILKQQGYSKKTLDTLKSVENASFEISQSGTNLEHSLAKAFITKYNLPKKYFLTGERTTNFLNQFKTQHDTTLLNAAKKYAQSAQTPKDYKEYKNVVNKTVKLVADKTGGYKIGYIDFDKNGKAFAVTDQESILKTVGDLGKNTTGLVKFIKNSVHHNKLFDAYKKNPNDPAFGTLRKEIKKGKYKFVREDDLEKSFNAIKDFNKKEDFISYYAKNPNDKIFQGLPMASGTKGGAGKAILAGTAGGSILATALAADEAQGSEPGVTGATGLSTGEKLAGAGTAVGAYKFRKPIIKGAKAVGRTALKALGPLAVPIELAFIGSDLKSGSSVPEALADVVMLGGIFRERDKRKFIEDKYGTETLNRYVASKTPGITDVMDMPTALPALSKELQAIDAEADAYLQTLRDQRAKEFKAKSALPKPEIDSFQAAGGGIAKLAGIDKGPQIISMNPDSQGLQGLMKRGIKT